jgi:hypothetical protein
MLRMNQSSTFITLYADLEQDKANIPRRVQSYLLLRFGDLIVSILG